MHVYLLHGLTYHERPLGAVPKLPRRHNRCPVVVPSDGGEDTTRYPRSYHHAICQHSLIRPLE